MNDKQNNLHASVMCTLCVSCVSHLYILRMKVERTEWKTVFSLLLYILVLLTKNVHVALICKQCFLMMDFTLTGAHTTEWKNELLPQRPCD